MKRFPVPTLWILLVAAMPAAGQDHTFHIAVPPGGHDVLFNAQVEAGVPFFERAIEVVGVEPLDFGDPITGAPYMAQATTEITQQLADGNRIERRTSSSVARDARGRVRREQQLAAIGPFANAGDTRIVTIVDPVAGVHYSLDEDRKTAVRLPLPTLVKAEAIKAGPPSAGVRVTMPLAAAPNTMDVKTERLAPTMMEGLRVEGTKSTMVIPSGAIGNQAPIEIVTERWYSPELQVVVYSRRSDPRVGETVYRLENIVRAEPAPELFRVPAEYAIRGKAGS